MTLTNAWQINMQSWMLLLLLSITAGLGLGCDKATTALRSNESQYVLIANVSSRPVGDEIILRNELPEDSSVFLEELYDLAIRHFPDGTWINYGPDSSYREIVFFSRGRKVELRSWHPLAEQDSRLVASSSGLTSLDGMSREEFLAQDDETYLAQRRTFEEIEKRLRDQYGS